ncbi:cytochrome c biogenesis protein CcdA [Candidatus Riflebacteria bacterium]
MESELLNISFRGFLLHLKLNKKQKRRFFSYVSVFLLFFIFFVNGPLVFEAQEKKEEALNISYQVFKLNDRTIVLRFQLNHGWHINSHKPNEEFLLPAVLKLSKKNPGKVHYSRAKELNFSISKKPVSVFEGIFDFVIELDNALVPAPFEAELSYQGCTDDVCALPGELKISGKDIKPFTESELMGGLKLIDFQKNGQRQSSTPEKGAAEDYGKTKKGSLVDTLSKSSLLLGFFLLYLTGLGLNLTPCVYPMIPITIGFFVQQGSEDFKKQFFLALNYFFGICITYSLLGVFAAKTGSLFGSLLQEPLVVIFVALIFLGLALSMLGFYELNPPASLMNMFGGSKTGYLGSFFMGTTVGIVAAPCVGPVILGLLTYVGKLQDTFLGFLYFFGLSSGMGTPYLLLGIFSGSMKSIPRAGEWMNGVKKIFGTIFIGLTWNTLAPIIPGRVIAHAGWLIFGLCSLLYLFIEPSGNSVFKFRILKYLFALLIGMFGIHQALPPGRGMLLIEYGLPISSGYFKIHTNLQEKAGIKQLSWEPYTEERALAAKKSGRPIIIDFRAEWCAACKELEDHTFPDPMVQKELKRFKLLKIDMTGKKIPVDQEKIVKKYGVRGLPLIIFLNSAGIELRNNRVVGFLGPIDFIARLRKVP